MFMVHGVARDDRVVLAPEEWRALPLVLLLRPRESSCYADISTTLCESQKRRRRRRRNAGVHRMLSPVDMDGLVELPVRHAARVPARKHLTVGLYREGSIKDGGACSLEARTKARSS